MSPEEKEKMLELHETAGYFRAYSTSLKKELKSKDVEIGKLLSRIQELEDQKTLVKGDLKAYRKEVFIQDLHKKIKELKETNKALLCKIGVQHGNKNS